ncbi:MAG: hypothetical protein QXS37_06100 [Candidatus Aenigmatarchaeota archaeon]
MTQTQLTQTQPKLKIKEIIFKMNIPDTEIEKVLDRVMVKKILEDSPIIESPKILTYIHRTWGSCREWKLVSLKNEDEFIEGEWINKSSMKNTFKMKLTDVEELPKEIIVYYFESPSCNGKKQFKFKVVAEVVR